MDRKPFLVLCFFLLSCSSGGLSSEVDSAADTERGQDSPDVHIQIQDGDDEQNSPDSTEDADSPPVRLALEAAEKVAPGFFPETRPYRTGRLKVSEIHELYFELIGNKDGTKVIVLHGGPGGRAGPYMRRFFDPERFNVLLFDQRGAGRSRPRAEYRENTTQLLIEDINTLRKHVGFRDDEKALLFGGSWGSTLAVAYAEAYPEKVSGLVLRGVFLASKAEIDHFYHGGTEVFYPQNFARLQSVLPHPEQKNYPEQLFKMITGGDKNLRTKAIREWARYEIRMVSVEMTAERAEKISKRGMESFSTLENHYMMNGCFLEEGQLLRDAHKIAHIPTAIINGRYDVICPPKTALDLAVKLKNVKVDIVPGVAHSSRDLKLARAMLRGLDWVADHIKNN